MTEERSDMKRHYAGISKKRMGDVMRGEEEGLTVAPSVNVEDKITEVIQYMVKKNLKQIVVEQEGKRVGVVTLDELLEEMGLDMP